VHKILELLETSPVIETYGILDFRQGKDFYYIKAKAVLKDKGALYIREYISKEERLYSYHWQDKNSRLVCRWDNASHYKQLETFPHHKHTFEGKVERSSEIDLERVLKHIEQVFKT